MGKRPNTILKSVLIPFLLVFFTLLLTHIGMQTHLMDHELNRLIGQNMATQVEVIKDYFITDREKSLLSRLQNIFSSTPPDNPDDWPEYQEVCFSQLGKLRHDLPLDYVALFDPKGRLIAHHHLSPVYETESITECQECRRLIEQGKMRGEAFGIDRSANGLVSKIFFPLINHRNEISGYILAVRSLTMRFFGRINQLSGLDILIFEGDQAVFSTIPIGVGESFSLPSKIWEAFQAGNPTGLYSTERIYIFDNEYHAVSYPFHNLQGEVVGAAVFVSDLEMKKQSLRKMVLKLLWASLIGGTLLLFFGFLISKGITIPISQLTQAARRVASGDLNARVEVKSHRELITLSQDFNTMTESLKRTLISKNYFYGLINAINDLLIIISPEHTIEFVNETTLKVLGYAGEELLSRPFDLFFKGDYPLKGIDPKAVIGPNGHGRDYSCTMRTKSGESIPVRLAWSVMWDEKKHHLEIINVVRDVRDQAEAEHRIKEERDKLDALINTTNDLIFIRNCRGEITFVSHAVQRILGYSPEVFKNLPLDNLLSSNPLNQTFRESPHQWCSGNGKIEPYWTELVANDGKLIFIEINESPVRGKRGEIMQIMGIGRDISERKRLEDQLREYQEKQTQKFKGIYRFGDIIGQSKKMREIYDLIKIVSQNNSTVLLRGESGTGKELIARAIHSHSPRERCPFVEVTCSVLSEHLLESELFGHVKGAFTGAIKDRPGRFEQAEGGTIFLDEIGDISLNQQIKLLRVLQEREIVRVGGERRIKVDVRIIGATNKDLEKAVAEGAFREDLYYRLNVVPITVPPLRDRKEDIPLLVENFMERICDKLGKHVRDISQKAMNMLLEYYWPGNIRQLENALEYALIRCQGTEIKTRCLPLEIRNSQTEKPSVQDVVANTEKTIIIDTLKSCQWDVTQAAKKLEISRTTLWRRMKKYHIER
ncbi:MAG: sigma 54-interacting transcriptional regulator [bacterium]